jgi:hypothetical protein
LSCKKHPDASTIYNFFAFTANPNFFTILEMLHFDARRLHTFAAHQHHVGPRQRGLALDDSALLGFGGGSGMPFDHIYVFDKDSVLFTVNLQHFADLTLVFAGNNFNLVVFFDIAFSLYHEQLPLLNIVARNGFKTSD